MRCGKLDVAMKSTIENPQTEAVQRVYIGIDYHKKYSTYAVIDEAGESVERGRIDHRRPEDFKALVKGWPEVRVVFEATSNWHWVFEVLEEAIGRDRLTMANPFKTRVIAEAQVKTDKVDAAILAQLLRAGLICAVHIPAKETRQRKEVLRQRCFFVRQRTRVRNRIHRLVSGQHGLELPQLSDLFGVQGMSFLRKLQLPAPDGALLKQQVALLDELQARIKEDEKLLKQMHGEHPLLGHILSLPGMGPILGAVVINEIDDISRFTSAQKFCGYAGLCPPHDQQQRRQDVQRQAFQALQQMAAVGLYRGRLDRDPSRWLLGGALPAQARGRQKTILGHRLRGPASGSHHLAALDPKARFCYKSSCPKKPRPACSHRGARPGGRFGQGWGFRRPHGQSALPAQGRKTFPSRSFNCLIGHEILTDPDGASWDRMEGWGSNCVILNGGSLRSPPHRED